MGWFGSSKDKSKDKKSKEAERPAQDNSQARPSTPYIPTHAYEDALQAGPSEPSHVRVAKIRAAARERLALEAAKMGTTDRRALAGTGYFVDHDMVRQEEERQRLMYAGGEYRHLPSHAYEDACQLGQEDPNVRAAKNREANRQRIAKEKAEEERARRGASSSVNKTAQAHRLALFLNTGKGKCVNLHESSDYSKTPYVSSSSFAESSTDAGLSFRQTSEPHSHGNYPTGERFWVNRPQRPGPQHLNLALRPKHSGPYTSKFIEEGLATRQPGQARRSPSPDMYHADDERDSNDLSQGQRVKDRRRQHLSSSPNLRHKQCHTQSDNRGLKTGTSRDGGRITTEGRARPPKRALDATEKLFRQQDPANNKKVKDWLGNLRERESDGLLSTDGLEQTISSSDERTSESSRGPGYDLLSGTGSDFDTGPTRRSEIATTKSETGSVRLNKTACLPPAYNFRSSGATRPSVGVSICPTRRPHPLREPLPFIPVKEAAQVPKPSASSSEETVKLKSKGKERATGPVYASDDLDFIADQQHMERAPRDLAELHKTINATDKSSSVQGDLGVCYAKLGQGSAEAPAPAAPEAAQQPGELEDPNSLPEIARREAVRAESEPMVGKVPGLNDNNGSSPSSSSYIVLTPRGSENDGSESESPRSTASKDSQVTVIRANFPRTAEASGWRCVSPGFSSFLEAQPCYSQESVTAAVEANGQRQPLTNSVREATKQHGASNGPSEKTKGKQPELSPLRFDEEGW